MGVGIYYFYHGFGLKVFEGRHTRMSYINYEKNKNLEYQLFTSLKTSLKHSNPSLLDTCYMTIFHRQCIHCFL
jgi:hypothetical protein